MLVMKFLILLLVYRHVRIAGHSLCERPAILSSVLSSVRATQ
jgi:hypothetical protein